MSRRAKNKTIEVLLVEDNPGDARLAWEAFKDGGEKVPNSLHLVTDGVEAMRFLLDLNLLRKDGREVLAEIKSDPELKLIPVIVMTTSRAEQDIVESYELQANAYLTKPLNFNEFMGVAKSFKSFWFCSVELPPVEDH